MKTIKLGLALTAMACCFAACSDDDPEITDNGQSQQSQQETATITLDSSILTNGIAFTEAGGQASVSFTASADWTLEIAATTSGATWCTASATSGSAGTATVTFTATENTDYDNRTVAVTVKAGSAGATFTITQKYADALLVTTDRYEIGEEGGTITVEVKSNIDYQMQVSEEAADWITEPSRALTTYTHTFDIAANTDKEKREGEIYFVSGDRIETVKVYQEGDTSSDVLLLSQNEYIVNSEGETITVEVTSTVEYGIQMPDVTWVNEKATDSSHTLQFVVDANEEYDSRSAEIVFYAKNNAKLKDTLTIIQAQKDAIILSKKEMEVAADGETIEVKVDTNVDFDVEMPDANWITKEETNTRSLVTHTLNFRVAANNTYDSRSAQIIFYDKNSDVKDTLTIVQKTTMEEDIYTVHVATAGTLKSLLGDDVYSLTSLKITGYLNGDDIYCLRTMMGGGEEYENVKTNLVFWDLSEAHIVAGGKYHYSSYTDEIGMQTFQKCYMKKIILPNSVTSIGIRAFSGCISLVSITIPEGVTEIGYQAFEGCINLVNITIPESVTYIGQDAFAGCTSLVSITIPEGVTEISNYIFEECTSLQEVTLPESITAIGRSAFYNCKSLVNIKIPESVTFIGQDAFYGCVSLVSITIPEGVTEITKDMFYGCTALVSVILPEGVTEIGDDAFYGCTSLPEITFPEGITTIGTNAFRECESIKSVTIPASVTSVGKYAFYQCIGLEEVNFLNDDLSTLDYVFYGCTALEEVTLPASVYYMNYTFYGCTALKEVTLPTSVKYMQYAFYGCSALTYITIEDVYDMRYAFSLCSSMISATIKGYVTSMDYAFYGCRSLTSVNLEKGAYDTSFAFLSCSGLVSITLPEGMTSVGRYAFSGCTSLTNVTLPKSLKEIKDTAFRTCSSLVSIDIPEGITVINPNTFCDCTSLESITLPESLTEIKGSAFMRCTSLASMYCYAETPPTLSNSPFRDANEEMIVYVPVGCVDAYKESSDWETYTIQEMTE